MAPNQILTQKEKQTKKGWLILLFVAVLTNVAVFFGWLGSMPDLPLFARLAGIAGAATMAYLYYLICYRRTTTFLLTFSLICFWVTLLTNMYLLSQRMIPFDLLFKITLVTGSLNYYFTWQLRRLNKALKEYAKFPEESREATAFIQSAASPIELKVFIAEGLKKWPHLKWVLKREQRIKESIFCSP